MKKVKRIFRFGLIVFLIILASFGVGLTGAAPVNAQKRNTRRKELAKTELTDEKKQKDMSIKEIS